MSDRVPTPDRRYVVSRGVLRRATDPRLDDTSRRRALKALMQARMALRASPDDPAARAAVEAAKRALGEAGPVWWDDGAPDESFTPVERSSYAAWWKSREP